MAISRARGESHVHLVTPDPAQAAARLGWEWALQRRQPWTLEQHPQRAVWDLRDDRHQLQQQIPDDRSHQLRHTRTQHARDTEELSDLLAGRGRWEHHPAGIAARGYLGAQHRLELAKARVETSGLGWRTRRRAGQELEAARQTFDQARQTWIEHGSEIAGRFSERIGYQSRQIDQLERHQQERQTFLEQHPDLVQRIGELDQAISRADQLERHHHHERQLQQLELGRSLSDDTGLGL